MGRNNIEISKRRSQNPAKSRTIGRTIAKTNSAVVHSKAKSPSANIRVVVRVRPTNEKENGENSRYVVKVMDKNMLIFDPKKETESFFFRGVQQKGRDLLKKQPKDLQFIFDKVFDYGASNDQVFQDSTCSLIDTLMEGYNCSVFAYGATGAGKTYTMTGCKKTPGITFLTMTQLFQKLDELSPERNFELGITYLEVYNELVKDLLNPGKPLNLREDGTYGVIVSGIRVFKITNPEELFSLLEKGNRNRTQHPTDANAESSRSHAVFQVYIQMTVKTSREVRAAKLSMIDLAGSERGSATGCTGVRFTEGANINKSLLALGNCINSLADGHRHVPYRDSKLTRLLKDSLGGNCQTVMIANVSPSSLSYEDTYNTLKYAHRAKKITSEMKRNVFNVEMHVGHYVKIVEALKKENAALKAELDKETSSTKSSNDDITELNKRIQDLEDEIVLLKDKKSSCKKIIDVEIADLKAEHKEDVLKSSSETRVLREEIIDLRDEITDLKKQLHSERLGKAALQKDNDNLKEGLKLGSFEIEDNLKMEVDMCFEEKKNFINKQFQIKKAEAIACIQMTLKEEADSRISDIITNTPDKDEAHRKMGNVMQRLKKQEETFSKDLIIGKKTLADLDKKISLLIRNHPKIFSYVELKNAEFNILEIKNQLTLEEKISELLREKHNQEYDLINQMTAVLKPCFMQLECHGLVSENLKKKYQDLIQNFQGRKRNIKWGDVPGDNGNEVNGVAKENSRTASAEKRKIHDRDENDSKGNFNSTFVLEQKEADEQIKAKQPAILSSDLIAKDPPPKRTASKLLIAAAARKQISPLRANSKLTARPIKALGERPPFRT